MTPSQKILSLIETVDPNDGAGMDEIDALVNCYLSNREIHELPVNGTFSSWALDKDGRRVYMAESHGRGSLARVTVGRV